MKKFLMLIILCLTVLLVLSGCSADPGKETETPPLSQSESQPAEEVTEALFTSYGNLKSFTDSGEFVADITEKTPIYYCLHPETDALFYSVQNGESYEIYAYHDKTASFVAASSSPYFQLAEETLCFCSDGELYQSDLTGNNIVRIGYGDYAWFYLYEDLLFYLSEGTDSPGLYLKDLVTNQTEAILENNPNLSMKGMLQDKMIFADIHADTFQVYAYDTNDRVIQELDFINSAIFTFSDDTIYFSDSENSMHPTAISPAGKNKTELSQHEAVALFYVNENLYFSEDSPGTKLYRADLATKEVTEMPPDFQGLVAEKAK